MFLQTSNMLEVSLMIRLGLGPKTTWFVFSYRVILFWPTRLFRHKHGRKLFQHIIKNIEWFHSDKHHQWSSQRSLPAFTLPAFTSFDPTFKMHLILPSFILTLKKITLSVALNSTQITYNKPPLSNSWERGRQLIILNLIMFNMSVSGHVFKPCSNPLVTFNLFYSLNVAWVLSSAGLRCLRWLTGHLGKTPIKKTSPRRSSAPLLLPALSILIIPFFGWLAIVSLSNRSVIW